jgi:hypothetical protein
MQDKQDKYITKSSRLITEDDTKLSDPFMFPHSFVGKISFISSVQKILGSGIMLSDNCVLTLASLMINPYLDEGNDEDNGILDPKSIVFTPSSLVDSNCFGEIRVQEIYIPEEFLKNKENQSGYDYAILKLKEPIGIKLRRIFDIDEKVLDESIFSKTISNLPVEVIVPMGEAGKQYRIYTSFRGSFSKIRENVLEYIIDQKITIEKGCPIFVDYNGKINFVGMHTKTDNTNNINSGYRITITIVNQILSKVNEFEEKDVHCFNEIYGIIQLT